MRPRKAGAGIGRSPQGERGLKRVYRCHDWPVDRRSPQGERGLKPHWLRAAFPTLRSLPARGAWVETVQRLQHQRGSLRRSPQGERGLKLIFDEETGEVMCRSPQGERGLKRAAHARRCRGIRVAPRKGSVG